jgi:hypothetical protein
MSAAASERTTAVVEMRRCIGSARFGIEAHEAPIEDFPKQPSQKDGLGRMCKTHWNQYTAGLARDAKARKAAADETAVGSESAPTTDAPTVEPDGAPGEQASKRSRRAKSATVVEARRPPARASQSRLFQGPGRESGALSRPTRVGGECGRVVGPSRHVSAVWRPWAIVRGRDPGITGDYPP